MKNFTAPNLFMYPEVTVMKKFVISTLSLLLIFALFGCNAKPEKNISETKTVEQKQTEMSVNQYDGYELVSDLGTVKGIFTEQLVRYNGVLYGRSYGIIDVSSQIKQIGVIDKVIDKKYVPKIDGETNCEEIRNAGVYGEAGETVILFYNNEFVLFEKIDKDKKESVLTSEAIMPGGTIWGTFIIKEIDGTLVTMAKYDLKAGELKEGLYRGSIEPDGIEYKAGDIVTVVYDREIEETYPFGIKINEFYPAEYNCPS